MHLIFCNCPTYKTKYITKQFPNHLPTPPLLIVVSTPQLIYNDGVRNSCFSYSVFKNISLSAVLIFGDSVALKFAGDFVKGLQYMADIANISLLSSAGEMSFLGHRLSGDVVPRERTASPDNSEVPFLRQPSRESTQCTKRKRGKTVHSERRQIVANVARYFEKEVETQNQEIPKSPLDRTAAATGVSKSTVKRIKKELETGKIITLGKSRPRKGTIAMDDFDKCVLRRTIHEFYTVHRRVPTLLLLLNSMKEKINYGGSITSLHNTLKSMGFNWKRSSNQRKILMERFDIIAKRSHYLRMIRQYRKENRQLIFIDETWVTTNMTIGKCWQSEDELGLLSLAGSGERLVVVHAGKK